MLRLSSCQATCISRSMCLCPQTFICDSSAVFQVQPEQLRETGGDGSEDCSTGTQALTATKVQSCERSSERRQRCQGVPTHCVTVCQDQIRQARQRHNLLQAAAPGGPETNE